jgi:hypothetical protein
MGVFMNETNSAGVILEHRFYGASDPGPDLSAKSLNGLHNIDQAMDDLVYFAQHASASPLLCRLEFDIEIS